MRAWGLTVGGLCLGSLAVVATAAALPSTVAANILPVVASVAPSSGPLAGGQSVAIGGTGFSGATNVFFGGTDCPVGTCSVFVDDTHMTATTPAGAIAGTLHVTVKNDIGQSTPTSADQYTYLQPVPTITAVSPNTGPTAGGSPLITITGTDFSGAGFSATDLKFNGTDVNISSAYPCSGSAGGCFKVISATSISAYPPSGSGQVDITVTTASSDTTSVQTSTTSPADTYVYAPIPSITNDAPAAGPVGGGNSVTITGTGFESTNGSGANYRATSVTVDTTNISPCPGSPCFTVTSPTQLSITNLPPHGAGTVDITATTPGGTSATSSADQYTYVQPVPTITAVNPNAGPTAGGSPVITITGTNFSGTGFSATDLKFGGTDVNVATAYPCSGSAGGCFQVISATSISAYPPSGSAQVGITVTTASSDATSVQTSTTSPADTYVYAPIPSITNDAPAAGPVGGGNSVTITGTGFESTNASGANFSATAVAVGTTNISQQCPGSPGAPCFTVASAAQLSITNLPPHAASTVHITVTTPGGTSTPTSADQYTYLQPVPTITAVSPNTGPTAGGSPLITITGTDFSGAGFSATDLKFNGTDVNISSAYPCSGSAGGCFKVISATSISAYPPSGSGQVDITVTTASSDTTSVQTSTTSPADTYVYAPIPSITNDAPAAGPVGGGNSVTITGTGFESTNGSGANYRATSVTVDTTNISPCPGSPCFTVTSPTQLSITNLPPHGAGTVDITATTPGGTSATSSADQYTYVTAPTVTGVAPTSGPLSGGNAVTVTGTGFVGGGFTTSQVSVGGQSVTSACGSAPCFTVNNATSITVDVPAASAGTVHITVTTPGGTSTPTTADQYTYVAAPTVTSVTPNAGPLTGGTPVTVTGTGFTNVSTVSVGTTPISTTCGIAPCFTVVSATQITVDMPPEAAGFLNITVTTPGGISAVSPQDTFVYAPVPTVTAVSPQFGPTVGGNTVVITGTGFKSTNSPNADFTTVQVSNGTTNTAVTPCPSPPHAPCYNIDSATQITVEDFAPHAAGTVNLTVTTPGGTSAIVAADQYTYELLPNVTSVAPQAGPVAGGTSVILTGTDFTNANQVTVGSTAVTGACPATPCYTVNSATQITLTMPAEAAATVNITVTTPGGTSAIGVADTYAYAPIPTITKLTPNHGSSQGGANVTITGTGFRSGNYYSTSSVMVGTTNITVTPCPGTVTAPCYNVNSATQIFIEDFPAHATGSVFITVTTIGGTSATSSADKYIYGATFPTVTSISQRSGAEKGGNVVTIGGTNFSGTGFATTDVVFTGSGGLGTIDVPASSTYPCPSSTTGCFSVLSPSQISVFTPAEAAAGTVDITVVTDVGTSGNSTADQYTFIAPSAYSALAPFRVCDTRPKSPTPQCAGKTLGPRGTVAIQISGGPVPAGAQAVVLNITAINHSSTRTYITAFPSGGSVPLASNININGGATLANLVVAQLSASGGITIFNGAGSVDVLVDVQGYFASPAGSGLVPGEFHGIAPFRICDTLANTHTACAGTTNNPLPANTWRLIGLSGTGSVPPSGAAAAVFNLTATQETAATYLAITPPNGTDQCPTGAPPSSNLNTGANQNLPNRVISRLGPHNDICIYNGAGTANFIIDVNGWFGTGTESSAGALFYSVPPTRICDTRTGTGTECSGKPLAKASAKVVPVAGVMVVPGRGGVVNPPIAVVANLTGVSGTAATFFTLYPSDASRPGTSDLNPSAKDVIANLAIVQLATTGGLAGDVSLYNAAGSINAIVDVAGWFQQ